MIRRSLVVCALILAACGTGASVSDSTPSVDPTPAAGLTPVQVAAQPEHLTKADPAVKGASSNPLTATLELVAGDMHVVFTNNLDGEIDPCG